MRLSLPFVLWTPLLIALFIFIFPSQCFSQGLYSRSFGDTKDHPIIFLHGGPGSSSVFFEATTAELLARNGFFVVIYDRRGEGRSADKNARMDFDEAFRDLKSIYDHYGLKRASLLAFSFGGLIAAQFAEKNPDMVKTLVLCSALISQQQSYYTILRSARTIYEDQKDSLRLSKLASIAQMDTNSLAYRTLVFSHASANGFFTLRMPNDRAKAIYDTYKTDSLIVGYVKNERAVATFWEHEPRHNIDVTPQLQFLRKRSVPVYALYGKQDGLYSSKQIADLRHLIGKDHVEYLDNCSHTLFIDQQQMFLSALKTWLIKAR
ncbi:alpha/beta fold hydrolase [Dyadobacter aurulentus]|uniref:alpha/beta fold hydrolase n=1 Tax=Dyadobacter sp. UC 10 TaxID=2605428 RepID=UPI0011F34C90|nr:alpha/beta hydrolase [Dyadobacter sp. UC 10]KAA0992147.1 alpha/beta hydrolase [Dyadobacter sp. UC 10]